MRLADCLPLLNIRHEHARTNNVLETRSSALQCLTNDLYASSRLSISITLSYQLTIDANRSRTRYVDERADTNCA
jgi:hypothetical protein